MYYKGMENIEMANYYCATCGRVSQTQERCHELLMVPKGWQECGYCGTQPAMLNNPDSCAKCGNNFADTHDLFKAHSRYVGDAQLNSTNSGTTFDDFRAGWQARGGR